MLVISNIMCYKFMGLCPKVRVTYVADCKYKPVYIVYPKGGDK